MSEPAPASSAGARMASGLGRVRRAWRALPREQRFSALAALGLVVTMFLPWYSRTFPPLTRGGSPSSDSQTAIGAFTFVEAAILLVALAVLYLLFARAERRAFHLPGGDGTVIMVAGAWAGLLLAWRFFDKPDLGDNVSVGLRWGIFFALGAAVLLAYAGTRIRAAHRPEPPLPGRDRDPAGGTVHISDERPHLAETQVMGDRAPTEALPERPPADQLPPG